MNDAGLAHMSRKMLRDDSGGSGSFSGGIDYKGMCLCHLRILVSGYGHMRAD